MTRVELRGVTCGALSGFEGRFDAGIHLVLSDAVDGGPELVRLLSGTIRPRRGTVRIDGLAPHLRPDLRSKVGSLFSLEEAPEAPSVALHLSLVFALHACPLRAEQALAEWGLHGWGTRAPRSLSPGETRAIALLVALSIDSPALLALYDPLGTVLDRERVASVLETRAASAPVIAVTPSSRDAAQLGGSALWLRRGRVAGRRPLGVPPSVAAAEAFVRTDDTRELASALGADTAVTAVTWDVSGPGQVVVRGGDRDALALAVLRAAHASGAKILSITSTAARPLEAP